MLTPFTIDNILTTDHPNTQTRSVQRQHHTVCSPFNCGDGQNQVQLKTGSIRADAYSNNYSSADLHVSRVLSNLHDKHSTREPMCRDVRHSVVTEPICRDVRHSTREPICRDVRHSSIVTEPRLLASHGPLFLPLLAACLSPNDFTGIARISSFDDDNRLTRGQGHSFSASLIQDLCFNGLLK
jgi:hypothetical protein